MSETYDDEMNPEEEVTFLEPDSRIKEKIGSVDPRILLKPETLAAGEKAMEKQSDNILDAIQLNIKEMDESCKNAPQKDIKNSMGEIRTKAFFVKSNAGMIDYNLASNIAKSLYLYCDQTKEPDTEDLKVIQPHIDALKTVFTLKLKDGRDKEGEALYLELQNLVKKFKK